MKALIAFIGMAVGILTLIEINERIKKRKGPKQEPVEEDCDKSSCSDCGLTDICRKESKQHKQM